MWSDSRNAKYRFVRRRWHLLFAIVDGVGSRLVNGLQWIRSRCTDSTGTSALIEPRRILVVQLDHLGDAVISLPLLAALREQFPNSSLELLCSPWNVELLRMAGGIDRLHVLGLNRFARDWRGRLPVWLPALLHCAWRLRQHRFDLSIDARGDATIALLMWLAGIPRRIGWNCAGAGFLLTASPRFVPRRAEAESRRALLRLVGIPSEASRTPILRPDQQARDSIEHQLSTGMATHGPLIVMHIGAGTSAKRWPVAHWRELIGRLDDEDQARVVLVGSREDCRRATQILAAVATFETIQSEPCHATPLAEDWTGRLSLSELTALLEHAAVFVGADSGPAHLAAAVGTPVVTLFSGTNHPEQWRPAGNHVTVLSQPVTCGPCFRVACPVPGHACMQGLLPSTVAEAIRTELARVMVGERSLTNSSLRPESVEVILQ